jgi:2-oxo-4-hydroxy-4-carboxy-5-ureidoimidazoline decarboxylase
MNAEHIELTNLNSMNRAGFTQLLGGVFEHSPWVADQAWAARPFAGVAELHRAMVSVVSAAPRGKQIELLRAHPELAGKEALLGSMTRDSAAEQKGAGLVNLSAQEKQRIGKLNTDYRAKFGFPFIIAVREHTKAGIFGAFEQRLANDTDTELDTCLAQVYIITRLRLEGLIRAPSSSAA